MKKIVCVIYHDCNREARSMELVNCCRELGEVHYVSIAKPKMIEDITCYLIDKKNPLALFQLIYTAKRVIKKIKPDIVVLHDFDCSVLIPYIKQHFPKTKIVYDSSELYIPLHGESKTKRIKSESYVLYLKQRLTAFRGKYEKKYLKDADFVIAANIERAQIMKKYFKLKQVPMVFDNIHKIDDVYDLNKCSEKFDYSFIEDGFNILFAGGISEERETYKYIEAVNSVNDLKCNLIIVGSASEMAKDRFDKLKLKLKMNNVHYLGLLTRAELRYCIKKSQASVVVFDKDSYNTIYCASGKCYESLFEGVPILASENPPLKRLCDEYGIGVSNDNFADGIVSLFNNYDDIKNNVKKYMAGLNLSKRVKNLAENIERNLY